MAYSSEFQTPNLVCEVMASMVPVETKSILEPTAGEGNLVKALEKYHVYAPLDIFQIHGWWDCIVMNPPFSPMTIGYEILYKCMSMSNNIIALMPWLVLINSQKRTKDINDFGLKSVSHLPRSVFKGARVQCCILQMKRNFTGQTKLTFLDLPSQKSRATRPPRPWPLVAP